MRLRGHGDSFERESGAGTAICGWDLLKTAGRSVGGSRPAARSGIRVQLPPNRDWKLGACARRARSLALMAGETSAECRPG